MNRIPKIIHYCWFGKGEKPEDVKRYFRTWQRHMADYQFMEWNEDNFDIPGSNDYVREAYEKGKYAFVSDYVRMMALYRYGGVYLDTDVEILKPLGTHLEDADMVLGFESRRSLLTAFIAVIREHPMIGEFLETYSGRRFITESGNLDTTTINEKFSAWMEARGVRLDDDEYQEPGHGIKVYPREYFCGFDVQNWHTDITENTCAVHHMASSWVSGPQAVKRKIISVLQCLVGVKGYDKLKSFLRKQS